MASQSCQLTLLSNGFALDVQRCGLVAADVVGEFGGCAQVVCLSNRGNLALNSHRGEQEATHNNKVALE